jgi:hypothetical protein
LSALVSPANTALGGSINEGTVTFRVVDASNRVIGSAATSSTVSNGSASATFVLPARTRVGTYFIRATYNPRAVGPNFTASSDVSGAHTFTVQA